jgi:ATP-dependent helicase/DNAse subunit B
MNALCIIGTARSDRATRIDALLRKHAGEAVLLVPSRGYARRRRDDFIRENHLPGLWGEPILDIADFAASLLNDGAPVRRLDTLERKLLVQDALLASGVVPPGEAADGAGAGLANHLLAIITQLKQNAIEPADFAARLNVNGGMTPLDDFVSAVYVEYQRLLKDSQAFDVPGLYWAAAEHCLQGCPPALSRVRMLLLDGFDDFTPSELRLVRAAAEHTGGIVFGLHHDDAPERSDAYAVSAATLDALRAAFDLKLERAMESPPLARHAAIPRHLFWRDKPAPLDALAPTLSLVPCANERHEAETIARAARAAIQQGVAPDAIAVAYRGPGEGMRQAIEALHRFGVPVRAAQAVGADASTAARAVLGFLDAIAAWERDPVLEALAAPWLWPAEEAEYAGAFPYLVRRSQVIAGRSEWSQALRGLERRFSNKTASSRLPDAPKALASLLLRFDTLALQADAFPRQAYTAVYAAQLLKQLRAWPLRDTFARRFAADDIESELLGLESVERTLRLLAASPAKASDSLTLRAFTADLRQALADGAWRPRQTSAGVYCTDFAGLRNLCFHTVFIAGLIEGEAPQAPPLNAIYGARDISRLERAGVVLDSRRGFAARERATFLRGVESADASLALVWRVSKEGGREALPSPFVVEIEELFDASLRTPAPTAQALLPTPARAACAAEVAAAAAAAGPPAIAFLIDHFPRVAQGAAIERERWSAAPPAQHDGLLSDPRALESLAKRYGPGHVFSVNQLESYLQCPFQFLQRRLLGIEESDAAEPEFTPMLRGEMLHAALERLHRTFAPLPLCAVDEQVALAEASAAVRFVFEEYAWKNSGAPAVIAAAEALHMETLVGRYVRQERQRPLDPWRPERFEVVFGREGTSAAYTLDTTAGALSLEGRIDRIDTNADGTAARIVDYKLSATPSKADIEAGLDLQLSVYAAALEAALMPNVACQEAVYVGLGSGSVESALGKTPQDRADRFEAARTAAGEAVQGMREGRFPPMRASATCHGCGHAHACRYQESRMLRKV